MRRLAPLLFALLVGCGDDRATLAAGATASPEPQTILFTGSSTIGPLVAAAAEQYEAQHPHVQVDIQTGGSSRGIADARRGLADIGMTSRGLAPAEGAGLREHVLAKDGVGFLVNADNPLDDLSGGQLLEIFSGIKTDWAQVGGEPGEIVVINRPAGRSELTLVSDYFGIAPTSMVAATIAGENTQVLKLVAENPRAIAYVSIGSASHGITSGSQTKLLQLGGIPATAKRVSDGSYALSRPLVLVTRNDLKPAAQDFLEELLSAQMDELILARAFVPPLR